MELVKYVSSIVEVRNPYWRGTIKVIDVVMRLGVPSPPEETGQQQRERYQCRREVNMNGKCDR